MTSANPGGEPLVIGNEEALTRLRGIADALLTHDRDIVARCDDTVLRIGATGAPQFIRRARGYTPRPIKLPRSGPSVLAAGAWLKNTICITRGDEAFVSPHVGDLDNAATCGALIEMADHLCAVLDVEPQAVAHDLHPDFFSTRFALEFAAARSLPAHAVQHHHAHIAAVAAEHRFDGPLLGLALDGIGLGNDGAAWGGELLQVDGAEFRRLGHLASLAMPGGDAAAREPWRMAAAALHRIGRAEQIEARFAARPGAAAVAQMLARNLRCPPTTSMGRWFDAAAALLRVRETAPTRARRRCCSKRWPAAAKLALGAELSALVRILPDGTLDPTPLIARLADEDNAAAWRDAVPPRHRRRTCPLGRAGRRIHRLAHGRAGRWLLPECPADDGLVRAPRDPGVHVLEARQAPPNDGGISLGQAWVAICRMTHGD